MKIQEFRPWARRQLGDDGCGTTHVELTDPQLDQAMDNAKEWWNAMVGLYKETSLSIVAEQTEYDLSGVSPGIDEVTQVWLPETVNLIDWRGLYPGFLDVNGIPYDALGIGDNDSPQGTIVQTLQSIESARRIFGSEPEWEFVNENFVEGSPVRTLRLMPAPVETGTGIYLYRVDPKDIKPRMYKPRDLFLMREWALAEAKYMLGRIRGKFASGLPAAGGERQLDGEALITESREDKERLEAKVLGYAGPLMPVVG